MELAPPRGMRDFYPEDYRVREAIFEVWRSVAALHGFEGYDAPVVETEELLKRKAGEEIADQIYTFKDKSDRGLALRPEMTPSLARMIIARQGGLAFPLKWTTIAQCFRYERMTRGRKREHYQWNLDIVGEPSVMAEVEIVGAAVEAMKRLGIKEGEFKVRVGSRALLAELFAQSGIGPEHFAASCLALDKRGKIDDEEIKALLAGEGLNEANVARVFDLLAIRSLDHVEDVLGKGSAAVGNLREFFSLAGEIGPGGFVDFDVSVVRGLGYYTGIVFEAFDTAGKFRAIFGGGRYDNLLTALGGQPCPCVGLGFGDVVIQELLTELGRLPGGQNRVAYAIGYMTGDCRSAALRLAAKLRSGGSGADLALSAEKAKKFFARADKSGAAKAVFIGPDEMANGIAKAKDMRSRAEEEIELPRAL